MFYAKIKTLTICMNDYCDEMEPVLEKYLKNNNIEKIVVYDEEMMIPEFIEAMNQLSVDVESKKEFDLEMNEEPTNAMKLNVEEKEMKKIVIATTEDELNEDMKAQIAILSDKYDGIISGVIRYPDMLILKQPEIMTYTLKEAEPDYVKLTF